jgi:hypothetical protein
MVLATIRKSRQVTQPATTLIADTATECGLGFSSKKRTSASRCGAARGIARYGITPRGERQ